MVVIMYVLFHRQSDVGMQEAEGGFYTQLFTALYTTDIDLTVLRTDLDGELDRFTNDIYHSTFYDPHRTVSTDDRFVVHSDTKSVSG
jgi:hypothetical protein